ncbi:unnamed protein product [Polarella glacialis]|uniref:Uncharacterized protein n=1 Tax=Polarella glacialis TaxID=89957 RepID=A0A813FDI0_POLGL|nr:unnamed protein product [Polarella glacialis]|mmetsp:Transcript_1514/g.2308  ORF Transcript_1514/g.2308 Transcript_1514/m.2308 type:complete len:162 (-) Transcript_1514:216-701(-)
MVKRGAEAPSGQSGEVFAVSPEGVCQGVPNPERPQVHWTSGDCGAHTPSRSPVAAEEDEPMPEAESPPFAKRFDSGATRNIPGSQASTAASTPVIEASTSPEARARARASNLGRLPVRELKARLLDLGADLAGLTEKSELVVLLEQLEFLRMPEKVPPFEL